MPRIWFLILEHQVWLHCTIFFDIFLLALQSRNHYYFSLYFSYCSWENSIGTIWGWQKKHVRRLLFCIDNFDPFSLRTGLILPHRLGLCLVFNFDTCFYCFFIKKKIWGKSCRILFFFSFDSFLDIVCIFTWYLSSLCIDWLCLYMIESLWLISAKFSCAS
jgi:hypothetical protein